MVINVGRDAGAGTFTKLYMKIISKPLISERYHRQIVI